MSQQQTNQALKQIQNNAILIDKIDNLNEKYDEVLDLIDHQTTQKFANIPARFESSSSASDFSDDFGNQINQSHQEKVSKTESFRSQVIGFVEKAQQKGKNWLQSFKDTLSSDSIQNKLQEFKDNLSSKIVKLGNKIASLPEEIANKALMKTALDKVKQGRFLSSDDTEKSDSMTRAIESYKVGDFMVIATGKESFSLLDNQGNSLMDFTADESLKNPSLSFKSSHLEASKVLKELRNKPVELSREQTQKRNALITKVSQQIQALPKGSSVGKDRYIVRAYQGEKYLDNGFGKQLTKDDLSSASYRDLKILSSIIEQTQKQAQVDMAMPVFTKFLKAYEAYSKSDNGSSVTYNPDHKTLTFTSSRGETLKARNLGKGRWQYLEGNLSNKTLNQIKNSLEPTLDKYFQRKAEKQTTRQVLQTLG